MAVARANELSPPQIGCQAPVLEKRLFKWAFLMAAPLLVGCVLALLGKMADMLSRWRRRRKFRWLKSTDAASLLSPIGEGRTGEIRHQSNREVHDRTVGSFYVFLVIVYLVRCVPFCSLDKPQLSVLPLSQGTNNFLSSIGVQW